MLRSLVAFGAGVAFVVVLIGMAAAAPGGAPSGTAGASANKLLEHGIALFEHGDLEGAIAELEQAYALDSGPDVGYALGQALRKKGRCDQAIPYFRRAVEQSPSENFTRAAQYQIGRCVVENPTLGAPPSTPTPPAPGIAPTQPPTVAPPTRVKWWRDPAGGALLGVGLVSAVAGTALLARAEVEAKDAKQGLQSFHDASNVPALRIAGGITLGIGAGLVVGGIIRYALKARPNKVTAAVSQ